MIGRSPAHLASAPYRRLEGFSPPAIIAAAFAVAVGWLIAILPLPGLLAVAAAPIVVLILRRPVVALGLLLVAVPFGSIAELEIGDFSVSVVEPLVALLAISWLLRGASLHSIRLEGGPLLLATLAFTGLALLSITYALSLGAAFKEALKWLELLVVLVVARDVTREWTTRRTLLGVLLATGAAEALWGIGQAVSGTGPAVFALGGVLRAFGHFDQPNPFAGYLSTILPLATVMALTAAFGPARWLYALSAVIMGAAVFLSQSRGAWLGLGLAAVLLLLTWGGKGRKTLLGITFVGLSLLLLIASGLLPSTLVSRLGQTLEYFGVFDARTVTPTPENWAVVERMAHWQAGWDMFRSSPWLGVGAGNYAKAYEDFSVGSWQDPLGHAHNYYLNTLAELGALGLVLLATFLLAIGHVLGRPFLGAATHGSTSHHRSRAVLAGVLGAILVFCTHNLFDNLFVHSVNVHLAFLLALGLSAVPALDHPTPPTGPANPSPQ